MTDSPNLMLAKVSRYTVMLLELLEFVSRTHTQYLLLKMAVLTRAQSSITNNQLPCISSSARYPTATVCQPVHKDLCRFVKRIRDFMGR